MDDFNNYVFDLQKYKKALAMEGDSFVILCPPKKF